MKQDMEEHDRQKRKEMQSAMLKQATKVAEELAMKFMNKPVAKDQIDINVPGGKMNDPKMKVTNNVDVDGHEEKKKADEAARQSAEITKAMQALAAALKRPGGVNL